MLCYSTARAEKREKGVFMEVYFELIRVGTITKVTAIDAATGTEAIIQGPSSLSQKSLQQNALAKLRYIMEKNKKKGA